MEMAKHGEQREGVAVRASTYHHICTTQISPVRLLVPWGMRRSYVSPESVILLHAPCRTDIAAAVAAIYWTHRSVSHFAVLVSIFCCVW